MTKNPLILAALMAFTAQAKAVSFSDALFDFNVKMNLEKQSSNSMMPKWKTVVAHVCSREAVAKLTIMPVSPNLPGESIQAAEAIGQGIEFSPVSVPMFKGCAPVDEFALQNYASWDKAAVNSSLINLFKIGMDHKINPMDMLLLISFVDTKGNFNPVSFYVQDNYLDLLNLPVSTSSQKISSKISTKAIDKDQSVNLVLTATLEDSTLPIFQKLNTPALLHRDPIVKRILGLNTHTYLKVSDFLKFEVLYFLTKTSSASEWKTISETTEAELEFANGAANEIQKIQASSGYKKITSMNLSQMMGLYVSIYKDDLNDVIAISDANPQARLTKKDVAISAQEQLAAYNLQREKEADMISLISNITDISAAGAGAGQQIIDSILH